eukprot:gene9968-biopygen7692
MTMEHLREILSVIESTNQRKRRQRRGRRGGLRRNRGAVEQTGTVPYDPRRYNREELYTLQSGSRDPPRYHGPWDILRVAPEEEFVVEYGNVAEPLSTATSPASARPAHSDAESSSKSTGIPHPQPEPIVNPDAAVPTTQCTTIPSSMDSSSPSAGAALANLVPIDPYAVQNGGIVYVKLNDPDTVIRTGTVLELKYDYGYDPLSCTVVHRQPHSADVVIKNGHMTEYRTVQPSDVFHEQGRHHERKELKCRPAPPGKPLAVVPLL